MIICIGPILQYLVFMSIFLALNSIAHICYDATIVDDETPRALHTQVSNFMLSVNQEPQNSHPLASSIMPEC